MDLFEDNSFALVRKILSFFGIWPTLTYKERIFRYLVISFMSLYCIFGQVYYFTLMDFNWRSLVLKLQIFLGTICFSATYYTAILHFGEIQTIFSFIQQDWLRLKDDVKLKIMQRHVHETKLFTIINAFQCICIICSLVFPIILNELPSTYEETNSTDGFSIVSYLDYFIDRKTYYYPLLIYHIIVITITTTAGFACYTMYFWFIQHVCANLSIIKYEIQRPFINNQFKNITVKQTDNIHWIIDIIQCFSRTKEFMKVLNTLSNTNYLIQVSLICLILAIDFLYIPLILEYADSLNTIIMLFVITSFSLFLIYGFCYIGQRLIDYDSEVYTEACLIPLHKISVKVQKLLLTTLMMNAKLSTISVGKMFVVSHEFFSDLIRMSLSFAMVIHSTQK